MAKPTGKVVSVLAAGPLGPFADACRERTRHQLVNWRRSSA